jgi:hypothetical protein
MIPRMRLEEIDEAVIRQLVDDEVRESRTLDFKAQLDLTRDGKQALAEDVCAFANTVGGDLVFGMTAPGGVATELQPVVVDDLDEQLLRLTSFLRDAVEPRVTTALLSHAIPLAAGGHIVVLRVSSSPNAPHRVIRSGQFYLRNSVGKEPMDIHAIRTAFAFSDALAERAIAFRDQRLTQRRERRGPVPVPQGPLLAVHVVPVLSLTRRDSHAVEELKAAAEHLGRAQPAGYDLGRPTVIYEGVVCTSALDEHRQHFAYAQLFRDGCIELVATLTTGIAGEPGRPTIYPAQHELVLVQRGIPTIVQTLATLGTPMPAYLFVSLLGVHNLRVAITRPATRLAGFPSLPAHLAEIISTPVYVEDFGINAVELAGPALDALWNAVGIDHTQTNFGGALV